MRFAHAAALAAVLLCPLAAGATGTSRRAAPAPAAAASEAGSLCQPAVAAAEATAGVPAGLLRSISLVESGRPDPASGRAVAWPWTINAAGSGQFFASKEQAVAAVRALQAAGVRSIDVGCAQVNLMHHPAAFAGLEEAFDPATNTAYAARFLRSLHGATGGRWPLAAAAYHSWTPELGHAYAARVAAAWPDAARHGPWPVAPAPDALAAARGALVAARPDYSAFTPEFAARVRQMDRDRIAQIAPPAPAGARGAARAAAAPRTASAATPASFWVNRPPEPVPVRAALRGAGSTRLPAPEPVARPAAIARGGRAGAGTRLAAAGGF